MRNEVGSLAVCEKEEEKKLSCFLSISSCIIYFLSFLLIYNSDSITLSF